MSSLYTMRDSKVHVIHGKDAQHAAMLRRLLQRDTSPHLFSPNEDTPLFTTRKNATINTSVSPTRSSTPFVIALRLLGCLPLSIEKNGRVIFKVSFENKNTYKYDKYLS
jgi:hypothetical protein